MTGWYAVADDEPTESPDWDAFLAQLRPPDPDDGWVSLEEASAAAGVSRSALRSWYRRGWVPSRMVAGIHGPQRMVPLDAVVDRAMRSPRIRRQIDGARSVESQLHDLARRVEELERRLGIAP